MSNTFKKIVRVDDWGYVRYYLGARPDSPFGTWSHRNIDQSLLLKDGDELEILFPDKTRLTATAKVTVYTNRVSDHGHEYDVPSERLELVFPKRLTIHGLLVGIDPTKIWAKRFTNTPKKKQ